MKDQGELTELKFMCLAYEMGFIVSKPFGDNAKYDFLIDDKVSIKRIQVKSTQRKDHSKNNYCYNCSVAHGSLSKTYYTKDDIDAFVIYVIPEDAWYFIPIESVTGKTIKLYPHRTPIKNTYERFRIK
jgi:hypothetical protein